ncbi:hypothetical protein [Paenibacillus silagei]|uniref:hypothetical protein n=1 Tax=Paenibacillus silagei TaxID=1670801 RepID=UPI001AE731C5|nr:hypothetical protein [Paenibacillus silagei]
MTERASQKRKKECEQQIEELYAEVGKLTYSIIVAQKNLAANLPRDERLHLLEWDTPGLAIQVQADLLSLNRSSQYYQPVPPSSEEIRLKHRIDELYTKHIFLG